MADRLTTLFEDFDRGHLSRRQLLQALGVAVALRPAAALAQGQCGGARASLPECDPTPAKLPFAPTGWKTVLLDHFSLQVADVEKEAAYYAALMNWKVRSYDGKVALLDIGDWGGLEIRGGYRLPAPAAPPTPPAGGDPAAAGRGGNRGGGRGPSTAVFDSYCWGIEPWDTKNVEAELRKRGLNPIADHRGRDFQSFHVKDADGFGVQISNGHSKNRRQAPATGKLTVAPPFAATNWKTVWLDHISFSTSNYKEQAAFYHALLGWTLGRDEGSQNSVDIGDIGGAIIRRGGVGGGRATGAGNPGAPTAAPPRRAVINHISFGITPWDADAVKAELDKRGLSASIDTGGNGSTMEALRTAKYQSFHTRTPNGFDLQISHVTKANRSA
jgi:catechol 2,3-dioxygenase-like lactoylglutathione lyase family enzyme